MTDRRRLRMVPPLGKGSSEVPQRLAGGCVVEEWVDIAAWSPASWQHPLRSTDDVVMAVLLEARRLHRDACLEWVDTEGLDRGAIPSRRPRWRDLDAALPLLARWVRAHDGESA